MKQPKYEHLSLVKYSRNGSSSILLVTTREFGLDKSWYYSGKILDVTDQDHPKFVRRLKDIPESDLEGLPLEKKVKKIGSKIININPAVNE